MGSRTVTGIIYHPGGNTPWVGASIEFELMQLFESGGRTFPPERYPVTTGPGGAFSIALSVPASGCALYRVYAAGLRFDVALASGASLTLDELMALQNYPGVAPDGMQTLMDAVLAEIGDMSTLPTTPNNSIVEAIGTTALGTAASTISGAIAEDHTRLAVSIADDGTLRADAITLGLADGSVTEDKLGTDVKVGSLLGLTTTDQSSVSSAINEVDANADAVTSEVVAARDGQVDLHTYLQALVLDSPTSGAEVVSARGGSATLGDRLDASTNAADGTLKDGAVTGPAIAGAALAQPNIVWDPFNRDTVPSTNWGGRTRWRSDGCTLSLAAAPATHNPWGGANLLLSGFTGAGGAGKYIYLDELGIAEGDTLNFGAIAQSSGTYPNYYYRLGVRFHHSSGFIGSFIYGASLAGDGTMQMHSVAGVVVPAAATELLIYFERTSGTADILVAGMWGGKGTFVATMPTPSVDRSYDHQEIIDARGSMSTLDTRLDVALNHDGTPKSSIAASFLATPNIMWDPFNQFTVPGTSWGGRTRFYSNATTLALEAAPATANPWGGANLVLGSISVNGFGGKYLYMEELGVSVGDTLSFGAIAATASGTYHLGARCRDNTTWTGSFFAGATLTGDGTMQAHSLANVVIPAGAVSIVVFLWRVSGTDPINVAALWGGKGAFASSLPTVAADQRLLSEVIDARGGSATLGDRLGTIDSSGFSSAFDFYGRHLLHDWQAQIAKINQADTTSQAVIACIGDSWTSSERFYNPLRTWLWATYGAAGAGFANAADAANVAAQPTGVTRALLGTWTLYDSTAGARGVDIGHGTSLDSSTPASMAWTSAVHAFVLHYIAIPLGGKFRWKVDAGGWTTVDTANGTEIFASVTIGSLDGNSHVFTVEVTDAGTAGVTLCGVDCQKTGNGVRISDLHNNGSMTAHWAAVDATIWEAGLAALAPNLVTIMLGINDRGSSVAPATYYANLATIITRVRAAMPAADILLLCPGDAGAYPGTAQDYVSQMRQLAVDQSCACLDFYMSLGSYAAANARGLYADTVHLNAFGGQLVANLAVEKMLKVK